MLSNYVYPTQLLLTYKPKSLTDFERFHQAHPDIYKLFKQFAFEKIVMGFKHYSADAVLHAVRWHCDVSTTNQAPKINNNYTAFYARMFHKDFPEYDGFFETRKSKADL